MAQYQSFPGTAGDSRTLDKLKALQLPQLTGGSFLDVGCNEGFFCGFARYLGATRVVGIDQAAGYVKRARARFPDCEFLHQGWDTLPDEKFDVILLASALHYAEDQPALIERLVSRLAPRGVLVLELGIASARAGGWVKVKRGIDERMFPTMPLLRKLLAGYAWKWMGPSVTQDGDPVKRHVLHISRRLPVAYLLSAPPGYGKTSIANGLFPAAGVRLVSGDQQIERLARGEAEASPALAELVKADYSPFRLDQLLDTIFARGLGADLVALWLADAGPGDFALDVYVPALHQASVAQALGAAGYLPVTLSWDKVGSPLLPTSVLAEQAEKFYLSMAQPASAADAPRVEPAGFVDEIALHDGQLVIRGWAVDRSGVLPAELVVTLQGKSHRIAGFDRELRNDVQTHLRLPHALLGYRLALPAKGLADLAALEGQLRVAAVGEDGRQVEFPFSTPLVAAAALKPHSVP